MLQTLDEGYKVLQLRGQRLSPPLNAFYMMTLGNARALSLEGRIGAIAPGADADLVVLNARATPQMALRMETVDNLENELFLLETCGDDRAVSEVYVAGKAVKSGLARELQASASTCGCHPTRPCFRGDPWPLPRPSRRNRYTGAIFFRLEAPQGAGVPAESSGTPRFQKSADPTPSPCAGRAG